ncbi:hypothetical protein ACSSVZ_000194 [Amorphus sp. MBR-141]
MQAVGALDGGAVPWIVKPEIAQHDRLRRVVRGRRYPEWRSKRWIGRVPVHGSGSVSETRRKPCRS